MIEETNMINVSVNFLYVLSGLITGFYLLIRSIKTRFISILMLSIGNLLYSATIIISTIPDVSPLIRSLTVLNYPLFLLFFTKMVYYKNTKSIFPVLLILFIIFRVFYIIEINIFNIRIPTLVPLSSSEIIPYYIHLFLTITIIVPAFYWLGFSALNAYKKSKNQPLAKWILKRNKWVSIVMITTASFFFVFFFMPLDGSLYSSPLGIISAAFLSVGNVITSTTNFLIWLMPDWLKKILNNGKTAHSHLLSPVDIKEDGRQFSSLLNRKDIMQIINFIGDKLTSKLEKDPAAIKGLLMVAIRDDFGTESIYRINIESILSVLKYKVPGILERLGIENGQEIIDSILEDINDNSSLFVMMSV
ncbi:MAG: hypothetical protein ACTSVI_04815 [Promethearchaeota archaeon]